MFGYLLKENPTAREYLWRNLVNTDLPPVYFLRNNTTQISGHDSQGRVTYLSSQYLVGSSLVQLLYIAGA